MDNTLDFIVSFHNLRGDSIGERKKSFNKLIITPSLFQNKKQCTDALEKLVPNTYQEKLFYIDALLYFKHTQKLLGILKGGNQVFSTKIIKHPWFFKEAFKNIEADKLVNEFLPCLTYVVRKKLISRVSKCWSEEKINSLYDAVTNKYGLVAAIPILPKCSIVKIKSVLNENEIKLPPNKVIELFNKSEEVLKLYLDHYKLITQYTYDATKVVNHIALKNPKLLLELQKNEKLVAQSLGRRTSKNILKISKSDIMEDGERYIQFLNKAVLVKKLGPEFSTLYKQIFPKSFLKLSNFCSNDNLINNYPKKKRWQLFYQICTESFSNKSEDDILTSLNRQITKFKPPKEILHKWAKIHYEKRGNGFEDFLKYYPSLKAIDMVKVKINISSDRKRRCKLLDLLINICAANNDLVALEHVLEYLSVRYKNESKSTRTTCLTTIQYKFNLEEFNETHWKYINEQLIILKFSNDYYFYFLSSTFCENFLSFLVKNNKDTKQAFIRYFKDLYDQIFCHGLKLKDISIRQKVYIGLCRILPEVYTKEFENYNRNTNSFIFKVLQFSIDNPECPVNITKFPELVTKIQSIFNMKKTFEYHELKVVENVILYNNTFPHDAIPIEISIILDLFSCTIKDKTSVCWLTDVFQKLLPKKERSDFANELLVSYFKNIHDDHSGRDFVPWFLKNEPRTIVPYFDVIIKGNFYDNYSYVLDNRILKQYSHLKLDRILKEYILKQLDEVDTEETDTICNLIRRVYSLMTIEEFIEFVEDRYLPKQDKLDLEGQEFRSLYKIECDIARLLGKVDEPYKMLPTIMQFAKGDYLQSALPSLYCAFYKSPERVLYPYVEQLAKQAVSVRKHAIFLSCEVLDKEHTVNLLKTTNQKNSSSQKHLFSATLKYFLKNPSQDLLEKVIENMDTIDKHDTETLDSLKDVTIPRKYRSQYVEKCWYFYETLEALDIRIEDYLEKLVKSMSGNILNTLSHEFVTYVIKKYLASDASFRLINLDEFLVNILKDRKTDRVQNFDLVFKTLLKLNSNLVHQFFAAFLRAALDKNADKSFVLLFSEYWFKHFSVIKTLKAYVAMKLVLLKLDNVAVESYAHSVVKYMDELMAELSSLVFSVFKEQLIIILGSMDEDDKYKFYLAVLQHKSNAHACVLVLQVIEKVDEDDRKELRGIYNSIMDILKQVDIPIVTAYYESYVANGESK